MIEIRSKNLLCKEKQSETASAPNAEGIEKESETTQVVKANHSSWWGKIAIACKQAYESRFASCKQKIVDARASLERRVQQHPYLAMMIAAFATLALRELISLHRTNTAQKRSQFIQFFDKLRQARLTNEQQEVANLTKAIHDNKLMNLEIGIEPLDAISKEFVRLLSPHLEKLGIISEHYLAAQLTQSQINPAEKLRALKDC